MSHEVGANPSDDRPIRRPPARTSRRRVQQLVVQAQDLLEERLQNKTASPTETVAILRLGTETELANIERIKAQTEYLKAQQAKAQAETVSGELFKEAMDAIVRYQGGSRE
jgi:hypothetical protein